MKPTDLPTIRQTVIDVGGKLLCVSSCSELADLWQDHWKYCPLCGTDAEFDGYFYHVKGLKPVEN